MDGTKREIRQEMRRRRRALSAVDLTTAEQAVAAHGAALDAFRAAAIVIAYVSVDHEVPTGALIAAAFAAGKRVYLPGLAGTTMRFAEHRPGADLRPGARGIPEPLGDEIAVDDLSSAIALVPLLAWDESGSRVGRGGGHYDRTVAGSHRPRCLVGLGYTFQQCVALPRDPWDLQLDWVVTERGAVRCWRGDDPSPFRKEDEQHHDDLSRDGAGRRRAGNWAGLAGGLHPAPTS
jgi:5-formyltetrahydrofolate cyclo-ligase